MKSLLKIAALSLPFLLAAHAQEPATDPSLAMLEQKILYHPRAYAKGAIERFTASGGKPIVYQTAQGKQTAWLIPQAEGHEPERLWLVCGGNATLALDLESFCRSMPFKRDAWLLVDYPGYGECQGQSSPISIRENVTTSVSSALPVLKLDTTKLHGRFRVFGHSLGCAAALMAADAYHADAAVLCAPFTSTEEMARRIIQLPHGKRLTHIFDNRQGLAALEKNKGKAWILHGKDDEAIPVAMSEALAKEFSKVVKLSVIPGAHHNDLFVRAASELKKAMEQARK